MPSKLGLASLSEPLHSTTSTLQEPCTSIISSEEKEASTATPLPALPTLTRVVWAKWDPGE